MWTACLDFETTGLIDPAPVSVAVVRAEAGRAPVVLLSMLINPGKPIDEGARRVHGISADDVKDAPRWPDAVRDIADALTGAAAVACHNAPFDMPILIDGANRAGTPLPALAVFDTLVWSRALWWGNPETGRVQGRPPTMRLTDVSRRLDVELTNAHNAEADALAVALLLRPLIGLLREREPQHARDLATLSDWTARTGADHEAQLAAYFGREDARRWDLIRNTFAATKEAA